MTAAACGQRSSTSTNVDQTILASDPLRPGNCVSACVASYLSIPLEAVPHFVEFGSDLAGEETDQSAWWWMLVGFMAGHGLWPLELDDLDDRSIEASEVLFVAGPSERGVAHQVLYRDGELWHDPHPSRAGLLDVTEVLAWRPRQHDHAATTTEAPPVSAATYSSLSSRSISAAKSGICRSSHHVTAPPATRPTTAPIAPAFQASREALAAPAAAAASTATSSHQPRRFHRSGSFSFPMNIERRWAGGIA